MATRAGTLGGVVLLWVLAVATSLYGVPRHYITAGLFAIPTLAAVHSFSPRGVAAVAAISALLHVASAVHEDTPVLVWGFNLVALLAVGYLGVRSAVERDLAHQRASEAEETRGRLQRFMGMVGHDMRGPLFTLTGRIHLMADGLPESQQPNFKAIQDATSTMTRFAEDMADAARIGSGSFSIHPAPTDVVPILHQLVAGVAAGAPEHQIVLDTPEQMVGFWDGGRLEQLFANLLSNAIKYSPSGTTVCVRAARNGNNNVVVSVADQGVGMEPDELAHVFEPFARIDNQKTALVKGTGLGLYISRAIAEAQGGRLWVDSVPGTGSTFYVSLPS